MKSIIIAITIMIMIIDIVLVVRNNHVYRIGSRIIDAIYLYNKDCIDSGNYDDVIEYDVMTDYDKAILRIWDWSYTNIVSKEAFEKIEKYIRR